LIAVLVDMSYRIIFGFESILFCLFEGFGGGGKQNKMYGI
jgi:hypothetical protein